MRGKKVIKGIIIIGIVILMLSVIFVLWFVKVPTGIMLFPELAKTQLNNFIEYKWEAGETTDDNIQCILKFENDECILKFSGEGDLINFDKGDTRSWHSLNNMTVGWVVPINTIIIENGVTSIGQYTFINMNLNNVRIAESIDSIADNTFIKCNINSGDAMDLFYEGSKEQRNKIKKGTNWCDELSKKYIKSIKCSDGEILLENSD